MPEAVQEWHPRAEILTYEEIVRVVRVVAGLGVTKLRVTGGEPLTRRDVLKLFDALGRVPGIRQIGVSTNGVLLASPSAEGPLAHALRRRGVTAVNVSLDSLDPAVYASITGRDFLKRTLAGIEAARAAGFENIRINSVLMRGRSENGLCDLVGFAERKGLLLRFIELMPVSTAEVLDDENFLPVAEARRRIEERFGRLIPDPDFRTNGPAAYYRLPRGEQRIGFIGALTNLHFCDSCNKLRLTCDGKLRPCLGSHLEFDLKTPLRQGATDADIARFFQEVVVRKPKEHDFRGAYQPGRQMVAIGG